MNIVQILCTHVCTHVCNGKMMPVEVIPAMRGERNEEELWTGQIQP
jgi:hypothetical protein